MSDDEEYDEEEYDSEESDNEESDGSAQRHAATYVRELVNIDSSNPWYGYKYFGQVNRRAYASAQKAAEKRWKDENRDAMKKKHDMGLLYCIRKFGPHAFRNRVLQSCSGKDEARNKLQRWVDAEEKRLVAVGGGPFRGFGTKSTLNLTHGGQGERFASQEAKNLMKWEEFCEELLQYEAVENSTLVRFTFVSESGYRLGHRLHAVRRGALWKGTKYENERVQWLESRQRWYWNARHVNWDRFREELLEYEAVYESTLVPQDFVSASGYALGRRVGAVRKGYFWQNHPKKIERIAWLESRQQWHWNARESDEFHRGLSTRSQKMWADASEDTRKEWRKKLSEGHTPENIAQQVATQAALTAARHQRERASLTGDELEEFDKKIAKSKRNVARRQQQLEELRAVPGWENATSKDLKAARDAGVLANGNNYKAVLPPYERKKQQLSLLQTIPGWENAMHRDLTRAKAQGVLPDLRKLKRLVSATAAAAGPSAAPPPPVEEPKPKKERPCWQKWSDDEEDEQ